MLFPGVLRVARYSLNRHGNSARCGSSFGVFGVEMGYGKFFFGIYLAVGVVNYYLFSMVRSTPYSCLEYVLRNIALLI